MTMYEGKVIYLAPILAVPHFQEILIERKIGLPRPINLLEIKNFQRLGTLC